MVMPPRLSSSSGMQSIRRELQRRRPKPLAPKSSAATSKSRPGSAVTHTHAPRPRPHPSPRTTGVSPSTPPPSCSAPSSGAGGSASRATPSAAGVHLSPGTVVGVRTRTTKLKTGEALVLWLRAMIVSPTHGGYEVVYDGNWPPSDPYGTVHVPRRHVRMIKPSPSTRTPLPSLPPSSVPSSCASVTTTTVAAARKKEMRSEPRPTTAGKSLRFIRSLLPEMERHARAALPEY